MGLPDDQPDLARLLEVAAHVGNAWPYIEDMLPGGGIVPRFDVPGWSTAAGTLDPLIGEAWDRAVHPDDRAGYAELRATMRAGGPYSAEYRMVPTGAPVVWIHESGFAEQIDGGVVRLYGLLRDITEAVETEGVVRRIASTIDEFYFTDELSPSGAYHQLFGTDAKFALLGGVPDDTRPGESWDRIVHPEDRALFASLADELRAGVPVDTEYRLCGLDGVTRWIRVRCRARERLANGTVVVDGVAEDVTERRALQEELREREAMLREIVDSVDACLYTDECGLDGTRHERFSSPAIRRLVGAGTLVGPLPDWRSQVHPDDRERLDEYDRGLVACEATDVVYRLIGLDGVTRFVRDRARPWRRADGVILRSGVRSDVTAEHETSARLEVAYAEAERSRKEADRLARTDPLTGVFNRRHLTEAATEELDRAHRTGGATGLLVVDLDRFKLINDVHGHAAGDRALRLAAERIAGSLRGYDLLARLGGEEFVVLLPGVGNPSELRAAGERVVLAIRREPFVVADESVVLTASVGAAGSGAGELPLNELLDRADRALYAAKFGGRNRCVLFDDERRQDFVSDLVAVRLARTFSIAAGAREGMPPHHLEDVAELSARVALEIGLSSIESVRCRLAGWLHDVGKVAVPDRVLGKDGPLDPEEWTLMRAHTTIGEALVLQVPELADAAPAVRHHHERFDGSGYPDGLRANDIPLAARIVAVVDAYSAMTTRRVYSAARAPEQAIAELERCSGAHFDPAVVAAFTRVLRRAKIGERSA